jgi:Carboxypeptidase regulatory-like domain/TonB dependent receptor
MRFCTFKSLLVISCLALTRFLCLASSSLAQSTTQGAMAGTVLDPSDAAVPNAKVTVKNNGTNAEDSSTTDDSGYYRINNLTPATYTVTISASGFSDLRAESVDVQIGRVTDFSPHLSVASAGTSVTVSSELPEVNVTSAELGPVVNQTSIANLPINGGRWSDFALLTPSVNNDANGFGLVSVRGTSTLLNNFTVDGADNNQAFFSEERGRTRAGYSTAKEAVQEFQVNTSNYSAEYGRAAGAVINTVTKSGSNQFHGGVYFYDRDNTWGATNPYTTLTTQTSPGVFVSSPYKASDTRYIGGFGVGGPVIKDRLFFYVAYDKFYRDFPGTAVATSPKTFFAAPTAATINTLAQRIFNTDTPTADQLATAQTDYTNGLNALLGELGPVPRTGDQYILFPKLDWQINPNNRASFEVNVMRWSSPAGIQTQSSNTFGIASFGNDYVQDTWGIAIVNTSFTSSISNEARYQYGLDNEWENNQSPTAYELAKFVNPPGYSNPYALPPDVFITNGFDMGVPTFLNRPAFPFETRQQFADTVTWVKGRHTMKFGVDIAHANDLSKNLRFQYGSFSYASLLNYFSDFYATDSCGGLPCYSSFQQAFGPLGFSFSTTDFGIFAEDSWKITPRVTLTLGLRYDYEKLPGAESSLENPAVPQTTSLPSDTNNVGPRIGFAWDIFGNGKTVLRGGYGLFYGRIINSTIYNALINTGNTNGQLSYFYTPASGPTFPQIFSVPVGSARPNVVFFGPDFQAPQIQQFDLTFERELGWNTVFSASYLGSLGRSLPDFVDANIDTSVAVPTTYLVVDATGSSKLPNGATYTTNVFNTRLNPNYGSMTDIFSGISSSYNALVLQVNHRMSNNIQFNLNYTYGHSIDFGQNGSTFTDTNDLLVPNSIALEKGNSIFDVRQRFVGSVVANSPWKVAGWAGYFINGWQLSPIYQAQTGLPYSLVVSGSAPGGLGAGINGSNGRKGIDIFGRATFNMPSTQVLDIRLAKMFIFNERFRLEVLGDFFNLFNHVNVTGINNTGYIIATRGTVTGPDGSSVPCSTAAPCLQYNAPFGHVTNANSNYAYSSRQIQIGAKFYF